MRVVLLAVLFSLGVVTQAHADCDPASPDSDFDGVPDCSDQCPFDTFNATPGTCGCGSLEFDVNQDGITECVESCNVDFSRPTLICRCPVFKLLAPFIGPSAANICGAGAVLTSKTVLTVAPTVVVMRLADGTSSVQLFFQPFSRASLAAKNLLAHALPVELAYATASKTLHKLSKSGKLVVRYDAVVTSDTLAKVSRKRVAKTASITLLKLAPGSYSAKYRVLAQDKKGKIIFKTGFSPVKHFTVPG